MTSHSKPALAVVFSLGLYLVITSAFFPLEFLPVFDAKRVLQVTVFALVMIFTVAWAPLRASTAIQLSRLSVFKGYALALFFVIGVISALRLEHPAYALIDVFMIFIMLVLIAIVAASRGLSGESFDKWAVLFLAAMGFAVAIQEFMGFVVGWIFGTEFSYDQALIHFAHPRFYNQLQTWSIPVLAALPLLFPGKRWIKTGCIVLLGFQWFLVIALAARGTAVSLFIAMAFIAFWLPAQRRFWLKFQMGGLLVGVAIYFGIILLNGVLMPKTQSGDFVAYSVGRPMAHTSGRSTFWRLSIEDALNHPVLGAGPTRYACDSKIVLPAHPHNFLLRILGEWGVIAFLLLVILTVTIGVSFLKVLKHQSKESLTDPPLRAMLAISLIAGILHAYLSGLFIMPASQVAMILIAGWVLSLSGNKQSIPPYGFRAGGLILLAMILACITLAFAIKELNQMPEIEGQPDPYYRMAPRFWQDGRACGANRGPFAKYE